MIQLFMVPLLQKPYKQSFKDLFVSFWFGLFIYLFVYFYFKYILYFNICYTNSPQITVNNFQWASRHTNIC